MVSVDAAHCCLYFTHNDAFYNSVSEDRTVVQGLEHQVVHRRIAPLRHWFVFYCLKVVPAHIPPRTHTRTHAHAHTHTSVDVKHTGCA